MNNTLSKLIFGILVFFILCMIIAIGTVSLIDANDYKNTITQKFEEHFNYTLQLDGDIKISLYPWLGLEVKKITIKDPKNLANPIFLYADKIAFNIKTLPLLQSKYELDILQIHNATLNLRKNSDGKSNWDNFINSSEENTKQAEQDNTLALGSLILGGVDIKNTSFNWTDQTAGKAYKIKDINIAINKVADKQPVNIAITSHIASSTPAINADLQVQGTALYDTSAQAYSITPITATATLNGENIPHKKAQFKFNTNILFSQKNGTLSISDLTFTALDTLIEAQLNVENATSEKPTVVGKINMEGKNLLTILQILEIEELSKLRLQDKSFNLHANLNSKADHIVLSNLKAKFADTSISGQFEIQKMDADIMVTQGELNIDSNNLPILLQFASKLKTDTPKLQVYAEKLATIKEKKFTGKLKFYADLASQKIEIPILMIQAFGIKIDAHLNSKDQGKNQAIDGRLSILSEKISPLLYALDMDTIAKTLGNIAITVDITGKQNDLKLKPTIQAKIMQKNKAEKLMLNADIVVDITKQIVLANNINLRGLGLNVEADVKVEKSKEDVIFAGSMQFMQFNLRQLMQQLQQNIPITQDKKTLEKISLKTKFSGSKNMLSLDDFSLSLDDTKINMQASIKNFMESTEFNSTIKIDSLNLDRYLPPESTTADKKDAMPKKNSSPFYALQKTKGKNTLHIDKLIVKNLQLNNIDIGLKIENGLMTLDPIDIDLYQGTHKGNSILDTREKTIQFQANTQLSNVQMQPLIKDYTQSTTKIKGLSNFNTQISTQGTDVTQMKKNLQGEAKLAVTEVVLELPSLINTLKKLETILKNNILNTINNTVTKTQKITASFNIKEGLIKNNDLLINTVGFNINGGIDGKDILANLRDNSINYDLNIDINSIDTKLLVRCQGSIDAINSACKPDYSSIINSSGVVKNTIKKLIGDKTSKLLDKIPALKKEESTEKTDPDSLQNIKEKAVNKLLDKLF